MTCEAERTPWINFCRTLAAHHVGLDARMTIEVATSTNDRVTNNIARHLKMLPLPEGHAIGLGDLAAQWIAEGAA